MRVGSFVICIDDKFSIKQLKELKSIPKEGDYYTIRDIIEYPEYNNRVGIRLEEILNPPLKRKNKLHEPSFGIFRFKELEISPSFEEELQEVLDLELEPVKIKND